ncbi:Ig-like domain-containing protein, partial [Buttiauxella izardii]
PSVMPMQTLTDSVMPVSNLTPSVMPMQTLTDSVMPVSNLTPSVMPMSDLTLSTKITIDSLEPIETPDSNETSGSVTHVNGGSHSPDGFDVQNGNITAIGSNVHIWLSDGDTRPECANPDDQINYYHDGNPKGDGAHTDVFVAHPGSGYTTHQGGNQPIDIQQYLNAIHGDGQQAAGSGHSDYIFLPDRTGLDDTYTNTQGNSNNANVNVNTLDNISIGGSNGVDHNLSLSGVNGIEGIIFGDGSQPYLANNQRTEITSTHAPVGEPEAMVSGTVSGDVEAGDSVDLLVNDHIYHGTVVELADGHLGYHIAVKVADINAGHEVHATLTATDEAGNPFTATADHTFNVDDASEGSTELDASTAANVDLVIDPVTGDDVINHHESQDKTTDVSGTVTGDAREGDDVVVTVGGVSYGGHLFMQNSGELGFRIPVSTGYLVAGQGVHVQVTTTDEAGNTKILMEQDHTVKIDLGADATITIDNTNPDVIMDEDGHSTSMITGGVSGEARVGNIVHLNVHDNDYTGTVVDLGDGHLGYRIPVNTGDLAAGYSIRARIDVTDNAGNTTTATAEHAITQDVPASAPTHNDDAITHDAPVAMENPNPVTHVNGGSGSPDGFDVQEGKIVAVGSNVHLWISEGDLIPKCANPDEQIKHYGNNNGGGNPQGDGSHTDIFVVHQGSGYLQDGSHRELNAINGTTQQVDSGHKDYIFVQDGTESDYHFSFGSNNNANSNVNTLENVSVTGTNNDAGQGLHLQGVNHIEGIIFGDGSAHTANDSRTSIVHSDSHLEGTQTPPDVDHHALANLIENTDNIFHAAPSPETTLHREISAAPGWQPEHPSVGDTAEKVNLSDLAHELENGTDITSLIKGAGQGSGEVAHTVADAHIVSPVMSEPAVIDSVAHSSFDHLLAKPEHHY